MKKKTFNILTLLLLSILFFGSCKKELGGRKHNLSDSTNIDTTVSTIAYGNFNSIATDGTGNLYALPKSHNVNDTTTKDTIYKFTKTGNRSVFYIPPVTIDHDTVVINNLGCLTADSLNNVYVTNFTGGVTNILKITPAGSASKLYSNIGYPNNISTNTIAVDGNGYFYYNDFRGIHRIAGTDRVIITGGNFTFAVDQKGNVFYAASDFSGQVSIKEYLLGGSTVSIANFGNNQTSSNYGSNALTTDPSGNVYVSESYNNIAIIHKLIHTPYVNNNATWSTVKTIISSPIGHANGPIRQAQIGRVSHMAAGADYLYLSDGTGTANFLRLIAF